MVVNGDLLSRVGREDRRDGDGPGETTAVSTGAVPDMIANWVAGLVVMASGSFREFRWSWRWIDDGCRCSWSCYRLGR